MEKVFSADGTAIAYDRYGEGPAVVLVSGALQHRAIDPSTAQLAEALSRRFTVYHYDRRGRGGSDDMAAEYEFAEQALRAGEAVLYAAHGYPVKPAYGSAQKLHGSHEYLVEQELRDLYIVEREVEDLAALIDEAGGAAAVYGMSSGAALALEAAARGLGITRLALYEPPFNTGEDDRAVTEYYTRQLNALLAQGRRGEAVAFTLTMFGLPAEDVAALQRSPAWEHLEAAAPTLAYDNAIMGDGFVPTHRTAYVNVPVLVIDGGASFPFISAAAQALVDALPDARRCTLAGQSHAVDPEALAPVLLEFFA